MVIQAEVTHGDGQSIGFRCRVTNNGDAITTIYVNAVMAGIQKNTANFDLAAGAFVDLDDTEGLVLTSANINGLAAGTYDVVAQIIDYESGDILEDPTILSGIIRINAQISLSLTQPQAYIV